MRGVVLAVLLAVPWTSIAAGSSAWGSDDPTEAPPVDSQLQSGTRLAAKEVLAALGALDVDRLRRVLDQPTPAHADQVDATAALLVAGRRLANAAHAKFPGAATQIADGAITARDAAEIDQARVQINPDGVSADVFLPGQTMPMTFVQRDGAWRLRVVHPHAEAPDPQKQSALLRMTAEALNEAASEIEQDRYATPTDAEAAVRQKLNFVLMRRLAPASQPTTRP